MNKEQADEKLRKWLKFNSTNCTTYVKLLKGLRYFLNVPIDYKKNYSFNFLCIGSYREENVELSKEIFILSVSETIKGVFGLMCVRMYMYVSMCAPVSLIPRAVLKLFNSNLEGIL